MAPHPRLGAVPNLQVILALALIMVAVVITLVVIGAI